MTAAAPIRILTVCTHNRTRSVMTAAMLQAMLDERLGSSRAVVLSAGVGPPDLPAIPDAVDAMARRGLDVSGHRSRPITAELLDAADLVLTAERDHVVRVAMLSRAAYGRAMTLPEFIVRGGDSSPPAADDFRAWVERLTAERTSESYLRESIGEIADPTGSAARAFAAAVDRMEARCRAAADLIAAHARG